MFHMTNHYVIDMGFFLKPTPDIKVEMQTGMEPFVKETAI